MKKLILLTFSTVFLNAQNYKISDFSKDYYATVTKNSRDKTSQILKVFSLKNKKPLITQTVNLSEYDFKNTNPILQKSRMVIKVLLSMMILILTVKKTLQ
jgi:hypothetical protein